MASPVVPFNVHPDNVELFELAVEILTEEGEPEGVEMEYTSSIVPKENGNEKPTYMVHQLYQIFGVPTEKIPFGIPAKDIPDLQEPLTLSTGAPLVAIGTQTEGLVVPFGTKQNGRRAEIAKTDMLWKGIPNLPAIQLSSKSLKSVMFCERDYLNMPKAGTGAMPQMYDILDADSGHESRYIYLSQIIYEARKLLARPLTEENAAELIPIAEQITTVCTALQTTICCDPDAVDQVLCADFDLFNKQVRTTELSLAEMRPGSEGLKKLQKALFPKSDLPQDLIEARIMASIIRELTLPILGLMEYLVQYLGGDRGALIL